SIYDLVEKGIFEFWYTKNFALDMKRSEEGISRYNFMSSIIDNEENSDGNSAISRSVKSLSLKKIQIEFYLLFLGCVVALGALFVEFAFNFSFCEYSRQKNRHTLMRWKRTHQVTNVNFGQSDSEF